MNLAYESSLRIQLTNPAYESSLQIQLTNRAYIRLANRASGFRIELVNKAWESSSWLCNRASESGLQSELRIELTNRASGFRIELRIELQAFKSSFRLANRAVGYRIRTLTFSSNGRYSPLISRMKVIPRNYSGCESS